MAAAHLKGQSTDSAAFDLETPIADSVRVVAMERHFLSVVYQEADQARTLVAQMLAWAKQRQRAYLLGRAYNSLGIFHDVAGHSDSATWAYRRALAYAQRVGKPRWRHLLRAMTHNNLGLINWNKARHDSAIYHYYEALAHFDAIGLEQHQGTVLSNLGVIHLELEAFEKARSYHERALALDRTLGDTAKIAIDFINLGEYYLATDRLDSAAYYYRQALPIKRALGDHLGLGILYNELGKLARREKQLDKALGYFQLAVEHFQQLGRRKKGVAFSYSAMGQVYFFQQDYQRARHYLEKAVALNDSLEALDGLQVAYLRLAQVDSAQGRYDQALAHLRAGHRINRRLFDSEKSEQMTEIEQRYEAEKRDRQLAEQKAALAEAALQARQQRFYIILLLAVLAFLTAVGVGVYRRQRLRTAYFRKEAALNQKLVQEEARRRLEEERVRIARNLHDHIGAQLTLLASRLDLLAYKPDFKEHRSQVEALAGYSREALAQLRQTIWAMNNQQVSLTAFAQKLQEYLRRLPGKQIAFKGALEKAPSDLELNPTQTIELFRIAQEAITNAVKYGEAPICLSISWEQKEGALLLCLTDQGPGLSADAEKQGNGLSNMRERAKAIEARLEINALERGGTCISVRLPLNSVCL